ncbi:TIGR02530 family flagellar biosynthesis protein [Paenibacillus sp. MMS18-CY102]|uniref:TIGR02530 family flagellar biosynthesis protein n=1 Tax=Paenibacillus sp. MMS18-CY102 TaxID=2682849 RepID=UPI001365409F|nr:TIGR02530 family flagellar biosynthesis protein [Paenibacillus sp. MMS18-CY102]MWC26563.1 flagellar biosynthesis protein [Paenibacillus sp. MMS18-CY102]
MADGMKIGTLYPLPSRPGSINANVSERNRVSKQEKPFGQILQQQQSAIKFSHHAEQRIRQRGIQLQPEAIRKIENAVDQAASKGAVDSLIVMRDVALIVNVPNRTVVTALDHSQMAGNVFTQIDSAVVLT